MKNPRPPSDPLQTPSSQNSFSGVNALPSPNAPPVAAAPVGGANHVQFATAVPPPPPSIITTNGATAQGFDPMLFLQLEREDAHAPAAPNYRR